MKHSYHHPILVRNSDTREWYKDIEASLGGVYLDLAKALSPLLVGSYSIEEIYGKLLLEKFDPRLISKLFDWLDEKHLIVEADQSPLSDAEGELYKSQIDMFAYLLQSVNEGALQSRVGLKGQDLLKKSIVVIIGVERIGYSLLRALILAGVGRVIGVKSIDNDNNKMGVDISGYTERIHSELKSLNNFVKLEIVNRIDAIPEMLNETLPSLLIYCSDIFSDRTCDWLNKLSLANLIPLIVFRQMPLEILIGPLVIPRETACYECYNLRRKAVLYELDSFDKSSINHDIPALNFPIGTDFLALEIVKFLTDTIEPVTRSRVIRINIITGLTEVHPILKLPRCPACGVHKTKPRHKLWEE